MKMMGLWLLLCLGCLAVTSCGGDTRGQDCEGGVDCDSGQACVPIAFGCVDARSCVSTCEVPCGEDTDCASDEHCANRNGHLICQSSSVDNPWE